MTDPVSPATSPHIPGEPTRRSFLYKAWTAVVGGVVGLFPLVAGVAMFLDPLRKRAAGGGDAKEGFIKVGMLEAVPGDGTPARFTVIVERKQDAWTTYLNVPVGAVYVRKNDKGEYVAFSVTCPHLGCAVDFLPGRQQYLCPCHDSAFDINGTRTNKTPPRDMDTLEIDKDKLAKGEIWIKYQDFRTGHEDKVVKS